LLGPDVSGGSGIVGHSSTCEDAGDVFEYDDRRRNIANDPQELRPEPSIVGASRSAAGD
jgi:hypothetical protein